MSDKIAPITLTTLYEMMVDLTRRIELILSEYPSSSRRAPGVVMPSLPHFSSSISVTLGASHPRPRPHSVLQQHSSSISLATSTRALPRLRGSDHYSSSKATSPSSTMSKTLLRFEHTPEQSFWTF